MQPTVCLYILLGTLGDNQEYKIFQKEGKWTQGRL